MFNTEDDDEDATLGAVRYAVMPSLVALQQMRNRLHLAYLGKKLMKWTALATGKELRRLAIQMASTFQNYSEDMGKAFMLLARARYYIPTMSGVVLEDIGNTARITVGTSVRSVSGVKIHKLNFRDSTVDPYPYLGIGKGGISVTEAKLAWLKLLRLMIRILQQRTTFRQVEIAHKNATKKQNVLSRVIIPRIIVTMRYIMSELEEQEREETFRLKRFKQLKYKHMDQKAKDMAPKGVPKPKKEEEEEIPKYKKAKDKPIPEPMKGEPNTIETLIKKEKVEPMEVAEAFKEDEQLILDDKLIKSITDKITIEDILADEKMTESLTHTNICACCLSLFAVDDETGQFLCPLCQLEAKAKEENQDLKVDVVPCQNASPNSPQNKERLDHLMTHINEAMELAEQYKSEGVKSSSMDEFIKTCGAVKKRIGEITKPEPPCDCPTHAVPEQLVCETVPSAHTTPPTTIHTSARTSARTSAKTSARTTPVVSAQPSVCESCHLSMQPSTRGSSPPPSICDRPKEEPSDTFKLTPVPKPKLGFFEKKYKEIVKVTRLRNPDGTICEEKKVITIRTERRNPRVQDGPDVEYKEQKYIGACTTSSTRFGGGGGYDEGGGPGSCGGYNGAGGPGSCDGYDGAGGADGCGGYTYPGDTDATSGYGGSVGYDCGGVCTAGGQDYGDVETGSNREQKAYAPIETKSEALNHSPPMGEPTLRACASSGYQRSGISDASTDPNETCICFGISKTTLPSDKIKVCSQKASKATSVESKLCCPDCSRFVCSTELDSSPQSPRPQKYASKCTSAQTSVNAVPDKKETVDKSTGCIPTCGAKTSRSFKTMESKCTNTESIQKEVSSSSTRYETCFGKRKPVRTPSPTPSCNSKCSRRKGFTNSGCTIKIISKPPKVCSFERKDGESEIVLKGSMLNALRRMITPSCKSTQCNPEETESKNLCSMCQSKLTASSQRSQMKTRLNPACYTCRAKTEVEREEELVKEFCNSCGTLGKFSSTSASASTRSAAAGSSLTGSLSCMSKSKKSSDISVFSDYRPTCSSLAQTYTRSSVSYPSAKPSEISCPKNRVWTRRPPDARPSYTKDAMTSTRRSDRYDCRPLSNFKRVHACEKIRSEVCACHSDTHMLRRRSVCPMQQTQSYCDDLYLYQW